MAFIDVLKCEHSDMIVWKWCDERNQKREVELRIGTQLVVNQSQIAVFFKGGQIADIFGPGTHTLSTRNIPILASIINLPFGGHTPFIAELYYINKSVALDCKFEIPPFNILDPNFRIPIPVSVIGSFAIRVGEVRGFMEKVIGVSKSLTSEQLREYFRGVITEQVKAAVTRIARTEKISPMELEAAVMDVSDSVKEGVKIVVQRYSMHLELFNIEGIPIYDKEPRVQRVIDEYQRLMSQDIEERLRLKRRAENLDVYKVERSFDTTEAAASGIGKGNGMGCDLLGTIVGLGMAQPLAGAMGGVVTNSLNNSMSLQQQNHQNSTESICEAIKKLGELHAAGILTDEEFATKKQELLSKI